MASVNGMTSRKTILCGGLECAVAAGQALAADVRLLVTEMQVLAGGQVAAAPRSRSGRAKALRRRRCRENQDIGKTTGGGRSTMLWEGHTVT